MDLNPNLVREAVIGGMKTTEWSASWIWGSGEASPRNEWHCFRRSFTVPETGGTARLHISADSRYVLFVNGNRIGRGPVRSWPSEQFYDTYELGGHIRPGVNTIAVLVMHWGVANFYYLLGRGGLIAELEWEEAGAFDRAATGTSWRTKRLEAQTSAAPRMACQQAFAEVYDAGKWDDEWTLPGYDDDGWEQATVIGEAGSDALPWKSLVPRDIPFLTEEKIYPARILGLRRVKPPAWTAAIDLRNAMVPESKSHANPIKYCGFLAASIVMERAGRLTIGFPGGRRGDVRIGGRPITEWTGEAPEQYGELELPAGSHLLLIDVTAHYDHGGTFHLALDAAVPFRVEPPLPQGKPDVPFVLIGPFDHAVDIDHRGTRELRKDHPAYAALLAEGVTELSPFAEWIRAVPAGMYTEEDVFGSAVWQPVREAQAVQPGLERCLLPVPEPAVLPLFEDGDCQLIIDLGKEYSGFIGFELEAGAGTVVDLYGVEYLKDDYIQHTYWLDNTLRYRCREGRQSYVSPVRRGLRYLIVTIRGAKRPVKLHEVYMLQSNYPVADRGRFRCADPLLNDIWEISRHTTRLCMEDTFVDCPAYEQVFWVGDSRNEALVNYYVFGATDIVKRCLNLVPGSKDETPLLLDQVPSAWSSVIPNWTFFWATACREYADHTGDRDFAAAIWPSVAYALDHYLQHIDDNGLLAIKGWNLLDWAPIDQPNDGIVTHQNAFLVRTLREAASLAAFTGLPETAASRFTAAADRLSLAINRHLWDDAKRAYIDCIHADGRRSGSFSMQTQVVAYLCGVAEGERRAAIEDYLGDPPRGFVQIGSPFMSFFYYEALEQSGRTRMIADDIRRNYGQMIEHDATTCWEMYPNFAENRANPKQLTRSHCHAWSAAPGYFLGRSVLGVKRAGTGWSRVTVEPEPSGLAWARGSVPLPYGGSVDVSWEIAGGTMKLDVALPEGIELDVNIPDGLQGRVNVVRTGMYPAQG